MAKQTVNASHPHEAYFLVGGRQTKFLKLICEKYCEKETKPFNLRKPVSWEGRKVNFRFKKRRVRIGLSEKVKFLKRQLNK